MYFIDRDLGPSVADHLGNSGLRVVPYHERYPDDPRVPDETWIREAGGNREVIFTNDKRICRDPLARQAVFDTCAAAFITPRDLSHPDKAAMILKTINRVEHRVHKHDDTGFIAKIYANREVVVWRCGDELLVR